MSDDERERLQAAVDAVIIPWIKTNLALCRAGVGRMNAEEIAQHKILDQVEFLHLSGVDYSLTPLVVDALLAELTCVEAERYLRPEASDD